MCTVLKLETVDLQREIEREREREILKSKYIKISDIYIYRTVVTLFNTCQSFIVILFRDRSVKNVKLRSTLFQLNNIYIHI